MNAYWFQVWNSFSFSLIIGTPLLLFFKKLDAGVTVLGIVAALPPLLNIMQIPAARFVERVGYRAFVLRGWSVRSIFILGAAGVAFLPSSFDSVTRMILMLFLAFGYNLSRGISVCGYLPWMTLLVPEKARGRFLSRDQMCGISSIVLASLGCSWFLSHHDGLSAFGWVFLASFAAALASLHFLKRIPDVAVPPEAAASSTEPIPWGRMLRHKPFQQVLIFNVVTLLGWAGGGVLVIPLLRDVHEVTDATFMLLNSAWGVVFVCALALLGRVSDWAGNHPVLQVSVAVQLLHFAGWALIAAKILPFNLWSLGLQQVTWGLCFALFNVSNTRLLMNVVPAMGRSHFFALFSVITSLTAGSTPVLWGLAADAMDGWHHRLGPYDLNAFSTLYALVFCAVIASAVCLSRIKEPTSLSGKAFLRELLERTPARALPRIFPRRLWP